MNSKALIAEFIGTFALIFVGVGAIATNYIVRGRLFIGLTVVLGILAGGPLSGAAMNPARYLGPALMGGGLQYVWLYWLGPLAGGAAAALVYHHVLEDKRGATVFRAGELEDRQSASR